MRPPKHPNTIYVCSEVIQRRTGALTVEVLPNNLAKITFEDGHVVVVCTNGLHVRPDNLMLVICPKVPDADRTAFIFNDGNEGRRFVRASLSAFLCPYN
jgi:hypothetical protein